MNRTSIVAAFLAAATLGTACKKDPAGDAAPSGSASAAATPAGTTSAGASAAPQPSTPSSDEGVKLTKKPPVVGTKLSDEFKMGMALKLVTPKASVDLKEDEARTMDEEILEVTGNAVTKLRVTFSSDQKSTSQDGKPGKATKSVIVGKTYVLAFKNGKTVVLDEKQKPAPDAEAKAVTKHFASFGKSDPVVDALPDRAFKPGEAVTELTSAVTKQLKGTDDKLTMEDVKITFKGREGDRGVFTLAVTMKTGGPFKMTMPLTGSFAMRIADGAPTGIWIEGPINLELTDKDKAQGTSGQGTLKIASTYTYK